MDVAVELVAARGRTMTAGQVRYLCDVVREHEAQEAGDLLAEHIATLQAKVASLEEDAALSRVAENALRAEVERLKGDWAHTVGLLGLPSETAPRSAVTAAIITLANARETAESRLAAIWERASNKKALLDRAIDGVLQAVRWVVGAESKEYDGPGPEDMLEGDAPQEAKHECDATCVHAGVDAAETRRRDKDGWPPFPCSDTCTHDDAAKPGHPERVKEQSEAVNDVIDGGPESRGPVRVVDRGARREIDAYNSGWKDAVATVEERVRRALENASAEVLSAIEGAAP